TFAGYIFVVFWGNQVILYPSVVFDAVEDLIAYGTSSAEIHSDEDSEASSLRKQDYLRNWRASQSLHSTEWMAQKTHAWIYCHKVRSGKDWKKECTEYSAFFSPDSGDAVTRLVGPLFICHSSLKIKDFLKLFLCGSDLVHVCVFQSINRSLMIRGHTLDKRQPSGLFSQATATDATQLLRDILERRRQQCKEGSEMSFDA
ncbi:hypothetical protein STEG23_030298, partial [Scotinomys teguina]